MYTLDINECETGTDNCTQRCENTLGSFKCSCTLGCKLANDEVSCEGIWLYTWSYYVVFVFLDRYWWMQWYTCKCLWS